MIRALVTGMLCLFAGSLCAQTVPITGATCVSTGTVVVPTTIRITSGTYDGGCRTYIPGQGMASRLHGVRAICTGYAPGKCITSGNVTY